MAVASGARCGSASRVEAMVPARQARYQDDEDPAGRRSAGGRAVAQAGQQGHTGQADDQASKRQPPDPPAVQHRVQDQQPERNSSHQQRREAGRHRALADGDQAVAAEQEQDADDRAG
jgi:hypothetical protein